MKTPRQVLTDHHRAVEPKLDKMRNNVLENLTAGQARVRPLPLGEGQGEGVSLWSFLRPLRWHVTGLAAAWVLIALLNHNSSDAPAITIARKTSPPPREFALSLREYQRQIAELMELPEAASPPSPYVPRRRSDLIPISVVV
jgi:hypothetical protein